MSDPRPTAPHVPMLDDDREGGPLTPSWCVTCDDVKVPHVRDEGHECSFPVVSSVFAAVPPRSDR